MAQVTDLPHQDNFHDCGLFTLSFMHFFAYRTPQHIHHVAGQKGKAFGNLLLYFASAAGSAAATAASCAAVLIDPDGPSTSAAAAAAGIDELPVKEEGDNDHFLTSMWFTSKNPFYLRFSIMGALLQKLVDAGKAADSDALAVQIRHAEELSADYASKLEQPCAPCHMPLRACCSPARLQLHARGWQLPTLHRRDCDSCWKVVQICGARASVQGRFSAGQQAQEPRSKQQLRRRHWRPQGRAPPPAGDAPFTLVLYQV